MGFTKKRTNQIRKTSYAQQVRQIHKKMMEIKTHDVQTNNHKEVVTRRWSTKCMYKVVFHLFYGITILF